VIRNILSEFYRVRFDEIVPVDDMCSDWCTLLSVMDAFERNIESVQTKNRAASYRIDAICPDMVIEKIIPTIPKSRLNLLNILGEGSSGRVFRAQLLPDGADEICESKSVHSNRCFQINPQSHFVAVKVCTTTLDGKDQTDVHEENLRKMIELRHEIFLLSVMQHPNLIGLRGVCIDDVHPWVVMDIAMGGELCVQLTDPALLIQNVDEFMKVYDVEYLKFDNQNKVPIESVTHLAEAQKKVENVVGTTHQAIQQKSEYFFVCAKEHWNYRSNSSYHNFLSSRDQVCFYILSFFLIFLFFFLFLLVIHFKI
jgi:hypothetical protein